MNLGVGNPYPPSLLNVMQDFCCEMHFSDFVKGDIVVIYGGGTSSMCMSPKSPATYSKKRAVADIMMCLMEKGELEGVPGDAVYRVGNRPPFTLNLMLRLVNTTTRVVVDDYKPVYLIRTERTEDGGANVFARLIGAIPKELK